MTINTARYRLGGTGTQTAALAFGGTGPTAALTEFGMEQIGLKSMI
jgi:hypothetical protein